MIVGEEMGLVGESALISIWATFMGVESKGLGLFSNGGASIMEEGRNEGNVSFRGCPLITWTMGIWPTNMVREGGQGVYWSNSLLHLIYCRIEIFLPFLLELLV